MKIFFEPNLKYQQDAVNSVVKLFEGAPYTRPTDTILAEVSRNILNITVEDILKNFNTIVKDNEIMQSYKDERSLDFSVEMETGTGKTYVYLRTIFELNKVYGLTKFIIVVPSIAVREGVMKSLEMTKDHFKNLYNSTAEYFAYDSRKATQVRNFALSNTLQIMVTNIQAFNTDDRIINQERDANFDRKLIDLIRDTRPIIIMDEPQEGMDSSNMQKRFALLHPLCKLRYSATHKKMVNIVYQLTPYTAYNEGLVKKIEVFSIYEGNTQSNVQIEFEDIKLDKQKPPQAKLLVSFKLADNTFKTKSALFNDKNRSNLEDVTKNPVYRGWTISRILVDPLDETAKVKFSNGTELSKGAKIGGDKDAIFREQIRWTIKKHFDKKEKYRSLGIKVLTLFFIDRVAHYVDENGIIRKLFIELYKEEYQKKYGSEPDNIGNVHNGYFAKTNKGEYTDSEASMTKNKEIYDLIMKDKERLLSFDEPLEFIFSHSALGVGWDNQNIFNICTLNESESMIKKRQEIGRGLRLAVNQEGIRYRDNEEVQEGNEVNLLTVIANQSYYSFVQTYQSELHEEMGITSQVPKVRNAKEPAKTLKLNKEVFNSDDFQNLWKKISRKTRCRVVFREDEIIDKCIEALDDIVVQEEYIQIEANRIDAISIDAGVVSGGSKATEADSKASSISIDLVEEISDQTSLSAQTVVYILQGLMNKGMIQKNPIMYLAYAVKRIKKVLNEEMVRLVSYTPLQENYDASDFKELVTTYEDVIPVYHGLYDKVIYDSDIEKDFTLQIDGENQIKCFVKLPRWYKITTPIGPYIPDFALVIEKTRLENGDVTKYYFVIETKGSTEWEQLKESEMMKIKCAVKHFEAIGLNEYLAPVSGIIDFKKQANEKLHQHIFSYE